MNGMSLHPYPKGGLTQGVKFSIAMDHLSPQDEEDLRAASTVLPGLKAQFEAAQSNMQRHSRFVDSELLEGTALNFPRSLAPCLDFATCRYPPTHSW